MFFQILFHWLYLSFNCRSGIEHLQYLLIILSFFCHCTFSFPAICKEQRRCFINCFSDTCKVGMSNMLQSFWDFVENPPAKFSIALYHIILRIQLNISPSQKFHEPSWSPCNFFLFSTIFFFPLSTVLSFFLLSWSVWKFPFKSAQMYRSFTNFFHEFLYFFHCFF